MQKNQFDFDFLLAREATIFQKSVNFAGKKKFDNLRHDLSGPVPWLIPSRFDANFDKLVHAV